MISLVALLASAKPPHIVVIVADDLGIGDLPMFAGENTIIETPAIDALASRSLKLTNYHTMMVCSPSRAALHTGRYPMRYGLQTGVIRPGTNYGLNLNETMLPEVLRAHGFKTHAVGKWHLGFEHWEHTPTFRGYDSFYGYYNGMMDYFEHTNGESCSQNVSYLDLHEERGARCGPGCSKPVRCHSPSGQGARDSDCYSSHLFARKAERVIAAHDVADPLFLYLAFQAVHSPTEVPDAYVEKYKRKVDDVERQVFAGMVEAMDEGIGRVVSALKEKGIFEETLLIFTTDNGGPLTNSACTGGKCNDKAREDGFFFGQ
jgi:arylsulfatase A-like enzyme